MKRYCKYALFVLLVAAGCTVKAQPVAYAITQVDSLLLKGDKNIFIFMYTDWCTYCAAMKQTTFKNDSVVRLLNRHFYFVPFHAETRTEITLGGKSYQYMPSGAGTGVHQLALALSTEAPPVYPFIGVFNKNREMRFTSHNYIQAKDLIAVLNQLLQQPAKHEVTKPKR